MPPPVPIAAAAKPDKPDKGKLRFAAPDGFDLEGKAEGDTIEAVAELEIEEGGKLCLRKLNGIEVAGYDKPKPDTADFTSAVTGDTSED